MIKPSPETCCGCSVCEAVCTHGAITLRPDALGFLVAEVNPELCVECGICDKVCPFEQTLDKDKPQPKAFAARHIDSNEVSTSRSGAAFIAVSDYILERGGSVYGAAIDENCLVAHKRATSKDERNAFKGSKYVQSDLRNILQAIRADLAEGKEVMFSGTPCQTAALQKSIPTRLQEKLYVVDIVCHGVSSPAVWQEYLRWIERTEGNRVISADFRDKEIWGWDGLHRESFRLAGSHKKKTYPYTFYQPFLIRESCHHCPYANLNRPSDLTLGDLWSWQKVFPSLNDDKKGVSLILCNSSKGEKLLNAVRNQLTIKPVDIADCIQPNLQQPTRKDARQEAFESDFKVRGFDYVFKKYYGHSCLKMLKQYIKRILGRY